MNIPNILTLIRLFLIPTFAFIFILPWRYAHAVATAIFVFAALTDWLDGYLARNLNQTTILGAFLDPVVDKLMVVIALVLVVGEMGAVYVTIPALIIVGREIIVSALREWMAEIGKRTSVAVSFLGKIKTTIQMFAVALLLLYTPQNYAPLLTKLSGVLLLYAAAILTLWSMILYLKAAWPDLTLTPEKG